MGHSRDSSQDTPSRILSNTPNDTAGSERIHVTRNSSERARTVFEAEVNLVLNLDFKGWCDWCDSPASMLEYETAGGMD